MKTFLLFLTLKEACAVLVFNSHCSNQPLAGKINPFGEDAWYTDQNLLVVADGVGSWGDEGVDSSIYSNTLTLIAQKVYYHDVKKYSMYPKKLLIVCDDLNTNIGTSTLVILTLHQNKLNSAIIGDSQYILFEKLNNTFKIVHHNEGIQKKHNCPYQLGTRGDDPDSALARQYTVKAGDLVIVGSDGLFDNLYLKDIEKIVLDNVGKPPSVIADLLLRRTLKLASITSYFSPFSEHARRENQNQLGGKPDDVTIIVAYIEELR